ncbi:MAG: hypothetical protein AAF682_05185 [Planctomycetota bacterium]
MHRTPRAALILALLLVPSCRSTAPAVPVLATRSLAPVEYEARLVTHALRLDELAALQVEAPAEERTAPAAEDAFVDVATRVLRLDEELAYRSLGWSPHAKRAMRVDRRAVAALADRLVASGDATDVTAPRLVVRAGEVGATAITHQVAYLERFDVVASEHSLVADPKVDVAEEGLRMEVLPQAPVDGRIELAVELNMLSLEHPIATREARLPGIATEVSVQVPVTTRQTLRATASLALDDALLVGGLPTDEPGEWLFAIFAAAPLPESER